jgi:signal peptidase II
VLDRLFRAQDGFMSGRVVDFVDPGFWPVFNVADSAVTTGVVLFGLTWMKHPPPVQPTDDGSSDAAESPTLGSSVRPGGASGSLSRPGADRPVA